MDPKEFGTCTERPRLPTLKWEVDPLVTAQISCFNRSYAEKKYSFLDNAAFMAENGDEGPLTFYDPVNMLPVFKAPIGRSWDEFLEDSAEHGWPQFQDQEVVWENVRAMDDSEIVTINGVHLGHNFPEEDKLNRYCINLISVAGKPKL